MKSTLAGCTPQQARQSAMAMLARREHSRQELIDKLQRKGCDADLAQELVGKLEAERLLSDQRYAESLVHVRSERGYGPLRIQHELQQKGVADELIQRYVDVADAGWLELIQRVRCKRFGKQPPQDPKERARQARFLQYRGFTFEQIQRAVNPNDRD